MTTPAVQIVALGAANRLPQDGAAIVRSGGAMAGVDFETLLAGLVSGVDASTETTKTQASVQTDQTAAFEARPLMIWQAQEIETAAAESAETPVTESLPKRLTAEMMPDLALESAAPLPVETVSEDASAPVGFVPSAAKALAPSSSDFKDVAPEQSIAERIDTNIDTNNVSEASVRAERPTDTTARAKVVTEQNLVMDKGAAPDPQMTADDADPVEAAPKAQKLSPEKTETAKADTPDKVKVEVANTNAVALSPTVLLVTAEVVKPDLPKNEPVARPVAKGVPNAKTAEAPSLGAQAALLSALEGAAASEEVDAPELNAVATRASKVAAKAANKVEAPQDAPKDVQKDIVSAGRLTNLLSSLSSGLTAEAAPLATPVQSPALTPFQPVVTDTGAGLKFTPAPHTEASAQTYSPSQLASHTIENIAALSAQITRKVGQKTTTFDMELRPTDMGRVDVKLEIAADGKLSAALSFDSPMTEGQFRDRQDDLRRQLEQAGFQLEDDALTFSSRDHGRDHGSQHREPSQADTANDNSVAAPETPDDTHTLIGAQMQANWLSSDPTLYAHLNATGLYGGAQTLSLSVLV